MNENLVFQDAFLESLATSFRKRRKALKHHALDVKFLQGIEQSGMLRLEIELARMDKSRLRLWAWPDRLIWLDARRPSKKGWVWTWTYEGRLAGGRSTQDIIAALEDTFGMIYRIDASLTASLDEPWAKLLAQGPKIAR
jgi:hypothetical protein